MSSIDLKKLKLKCGIEIHQQLDTECKLFCGCSTKMEDSDIIEELERKQHPVTSELGNIDEAVKFEHIRDRKFIYQVLRKETCLVEMDEEPPHDVNPEALKAAVEIALFLNCDIPEELHIMRKTITDGSNTGGFQRTMIVGLNGNLKCFGKKIPIEQVCLEEDSAKKIDVGDGEVTYSLNRLGIPLVEITTGVMEDLTPDQIQEVAYTIGIICRSTRKTKSGIGTIRQDINVSIKGGERTEIKGVQELGMLSKVIEKEVERQVEALKAGDKVGNETRAAKPDGTTKYMRPLPGSARMYPETDVMPIVIEKSWIRKLREGMPECWTKKLERFKKKMGLSNDLAIQIITSAYLDVFEEIMKKHPKLNPTVVANVFTSTIVELRRRDKDIKILEDKHFLDIFYSLEKSKIVKEAIPDLLLNFINFPEEEISQSIKKLDLKLLSKRELKGVISKLIKDSPGIDKEKLTGIAIGRVRGKADPQEVIEIVNKLMKK